MSNVVRFDSPVETATRRMLLAWAGMAMKFGYSPYPLTVDDITLMQAELLKIKEFENAASVDPANMHVYIEKIFGKGDAA